MSNNKDMKEELHKLCDSFFQSEDEEKGSICFKLLNGLMNFMQ